MKRWRCWQATKRLHWHKWDFLMLFTLHSGFLQGKRQRRLDKLSLESQQAWRSFGACNFFWVFKTVKQNKFFFFNTTEGNEVTEECCSSASFFFPPLLKHPLVWTSSTGTLYSPEKQLESAKPQTFFFNPTMSSRKQGCFFFKPKREQ